MEKCSQISVKSIIMFSLFFFKRARGLGQLIRAKNIKTIGDLSTLTASEIKTLPIRSPKVFNVKKALRVYHEQQVKTCYLSVLHTCILCATCVQCLQRPEQGTRCLGTGVKDVCEQTWRCWETNPCSLKKQPVLVTADLFLQPKSHILVSDSSGSGIVPL